jgi:hypothetical protein
MPAAFREVYLLNYQTYWMRQMNLYGIPTSMRPAGKYGLENGVMM